MKVLCLSDSHFGKKKWGTQPVDKLIKNIEFSKEEHIDVLYFGGDLAEPGDSSHPLFYWEEGFYYLSQIKADHKVFVCGNNDIELIANIHDSMNSDNYASVVHSFMPKGWTLLDLEDHIFKCDGKEFRFAGNSLFWNGSLHLENDDPQNNWDRLLLFYKEKWSRIMGSFSQTDFMQLSNELYQKLIHSVSAAEKANQKVIIGTHTIPSKRCYQFEPEQSAEFLKSFYMGRDIEDLFLSNAVIAGFCGHTHSDDLAIIHGKPVRNVSSKKEIQCFSF